VILKLLQSQQKQQLPSDLHFTIFSLPLVFNLQLLVTFANAETDSTNRQKASNAMMETMTQETDALLLAIKKKDLIVSEAPTH